MLRLALLLAFLLGALPAQGRVLLVGLDGASWNVIDPMIARGELPALAALIARGVSADLATVKPVISPTVWTSIATGRSPDAHGITSFFAAADRRRAPTAFERLAARGRRVGLYDYLVTWPPATLPGGFVIPGWLRRDEQVTPADVWSRIDLAPFVTVYDGLKTNDDYLRMSAQEVEKKSSRWIALSKAFDLDVGAVTFYTPDTRSHRFWRAGYPDEFDDPGPKPSAAHANAIAEGYRGVDRSVGEIVAALSPEDVVILVSDHGFQAGDGPRPVWSGDFEPVLRDAGLEPGAGGFSVLSQFQVIALAVDLVGDERTLATQDALLDRLVVFLESFQSAQGEPLFSVYALDDAERPPGEERGWFNRLYQWFLRLVLRWGFGVQFEGRSHAVIFARPDSDALQALWPDATVRGDGRDLPLSDLFEYQEFTGDHLETAVLIAAGGPIRASGGRTTASVLDVAPLLFYLSGEPLPDDLEGTLPVDWFDPEHVSANPVRSAPASAFPALAAPSAPSSEPGPELDEKLRSLGYVE